MIPDMPADFARLLDDPTVAFTEHRVDRHRVGKRLTTGAVLTLFGLSLLYLVIVAGIPFHAAAHFIFVFLLSGVWMCWKTVRHGDAAVLLFPDVGFLWVRRGTLAAYRWSEVCSVAVHLAIDKEEPASLRRGPGGEITGAAFRHASKVPFRKVRESLTVTRADGQQVELTPVFADFEQLVEAIQYGTFQADWPSVRCEFDEGRRLAFGKLDVDRNGLFVQHSRLPWGEVKDISWKGGMLQIRKKGRAIPWHVVSVEHLVRPHVLLGLVRFALDKVPGRSADSFVSEAENS
jgi:hypothetical protein